MSAHPAPTATHCSDTAHPTERATAERATAHSPPRHLALHGGTASSWGPATTRKCVKDSVTGALCPEGPGAQEDACLSRVSALAESRGRGRGGEASCPWAALARAGVRRAAQEGRRQWLRWDKSRLTAATLFLSLSRYCSIRASSFTLPYRVTASRQRKQGLTKANERGKRGALGRAPLVCTPRGRVPHTKEVRGFEKMCFHMRHFETFHWLAPTPILMCVCVYVHVYMHTCTHTPLSR